MHYGRLIQDLLPFLLCFIQLGEGILSYNESIVKVNLDYNYYIKVQEMSTKTVLMWLKLLAVVEFVSMGEFYGLFMDFITESLPVLPLGYSGMYVDAKVTGQKFLCPSEAVKKMVD